MKNYVQYHNAVKQGPLQASSDDTFQIFARKSIKHIQFQKMWLISGHGKTGPKQYFLETSFLISEIHVGTPNLARGSSGKRFAPPIPLNQLPWFKDFVASQQNFSLGVREIASPFLEHFEALAQTSSV